MKVHGRILLGLAACLLAGTVLAHADKPTKGPQKDTAGDKGRKTVLAGQIIFTDDERVIVRDYFRVPRSGLPPGLAKRDRLPPGLEKQLRERGTLPPGLQKKVQPLPWELDRRLHRLPAGYRRVVIGASVIIMHQKTAVIYAVIRNVIP